VFLLVVIPGVCHPWCLLSPVHGHVRCPCHLLSSSPFVLPAVRCHGCTCSSSSRCSSSSVFAVPAVCCPPFVATIVVSTSNSPYEQWLGGGLVVLCDMAVVGAAEVADGGVVFWWCYVTWQQQRWLQFPLRAVARRRVGGAM
jgi:hypothetical protein